MANEVTSSTLNNMQLAYLNRRLMRVLDESVWLYEAAEKSPIPDSSGTTMTWNSWKRIAPSSASIAETLTAPGYAALSSRKVTATIAQYGRATAVTSLVDQTGISSALQGAVERLSQAAALTLDNVCQLGVFKNDMAQTGKDNNAKTKLLSGIYQAAAASAFCANTGTNSGSNKQFQFPVVFATSALKLSVVSKTAPSVSAVFGPIGIRKAVDRIRNFDAIPDADGLFMGFVHPRAVTAGLSNPDLKQWYLNFSGGPSLMYKGQFTTPLHGVKFKMSTNIPIYATSGLSAHLTPILGQGALGVTELTPGGAQIIVKSPGDQTTSDPFNMLNVVSYKLKAAAACLNPSAGVILISHFKSGT